jgi:hypothetical protein
MGMMEMEAVVMERKTHGKKVSGTRGRSQMELLWLERVPNGESLFLIRTRVAIGPGGGARPAAAKQIVGPCNAESQEQEGCRHTNQEHDQHEKN